MANVLLGQDTETGKHIYLTEEGRKLSTYIIGTIGTGKSTLLEQIAIQDMQHGDGICFLDPHEDAAERLLLHVPNHRKDDVILWDPSDLEYPFGLNPFYCPSPAHVDSTVGNFIEALGSLQEFSEIFKTAPLMKNMLENLALTFILNQRYTLAETPEFLENQTYRAQFYEAIPQRYNAVRRFWERFDKRTDTRQEQLVASSLNKLQRFQNTPTIGNIFGQETDSINFREVMDNRNIVIVKLSSSVNKLGAQNAAFLGAFIVWEIFQAAMSRDDTAEENRPQFHLLADEFQTYMTTAFPSLIEQVRKFNVDVTVAHQRRDQLPISSRNAPLVAGNKVVFTVTGHDAHELAKEFRIDIPDPDVARLQPKYNFAPNVLDHLAKRGHESDYVLELYNNIYKHLDTISDEIRNLIETAEFDYYDSIRKFDDIPSRMQEPDTQSHRFATNRKQEETKRKQFEQLLSNLLYRLMSRENPFVYRRDDISEYLNPYLDGVSDYLQCIPDYINAGYNRQVNVLVRALIDSKAQHDLDTRFYWKEIRKEYHYGRISKEEMDALKKKGHRERDIRYPDTYAGLTYADNLKHMATLHSYNTNPDNVTGDERPFWFLNKTFDDDTNENRFYRSIGLSELPDDTIIRISFYIKGFFYKIFQSVLYMGERLQKNPCLAPTGQYEPVLEKPRLYSDVEAEIANTLATLHRFTARCKLMQDGQANEYTITTFDRPGPDVWAESTAEEIKQNSRTFYGRGRAEVEAEIAERLRTTPSPKPERRVEPEQESLDLWEEG